MTDKTIDRDANGQPRKMPGWFSWRHQTRDAHDEAVARYKNRAAGRPSQRWDDDAKAWVKFEAPQSRLLRAIFGEVSA